MKCGRCPDMSVRRGNPWCERFGRPVLVVTEGDCDFVPEEIVHLDLAELVRRAQEMGSLPEPAAECGMRIAGASR